MSKSVAACSISFGLHWVVHPLTGRPVIRLLVNLPINGMFKESPECLVLIKSIPPCAEEFKATRIMKQRSYQPDLHNDEYIEQGFFKHRF